MKYIICLFFFFASLSTLYSCTTADGSKVVVTPDASEEILIQRFDKDLYNLLQAPSSENENTLKTKYSDFLNAFGSVTINNSDYTNETFFPSILKYFSNAMLSQIYKDAINAFEDIQLYEEELSKAKELANEHLGDKQFPNLCFHVSGFKANTILIQDFISISTDRYLGKDYVQYKDFFEEYQRIQMEPKMVVRDYLKAWLMSELPSDNKRNDLLSEMINEGKILYALQLLLPNWSETDLIGYTPEQLEWAENKQKDIWKSTLQQNNLYSTDHMTILKYMEEAPYTATISAESPGRLGAWLGWQIIKKYAHNKTTTLDVLLSETDNQAILKASKYNP